MSLSKLHEAVGAGGNKWQRQIDDLRAEVRRNRVVRSPGVLVSPGPNGTTLRLENRAVPSQSTGGTEAIVVWP